MLNSNSAKSSYSDLPQANNHKSRSQSIEKEAVYSHARILGIDPTERPDLLWIAEESLIADLSTPWMVAEVEPRSDEEVKSDETNPTPTIYYYNQETGESRWEHPSDEYYKNVVTSIMQRKSEHHPENKIKIEKNKISEQEGEDNETMKSNLELVLANDMLSHSRRKQVSEFDRTGKKSTPFTQSIESVLPWQHMQAFDSSTIQHGMVENMSIKEGIGESQEGLQSHSFGINIQNEQGNEEIEFSNVRLNKDTVIFNQRKQNENHVKPQKSVMHIREQLEYLRSIYKRKKKNWEEKETSYQNTVQKLTMKVQREQEKMKSIKLEHEIRVDQKESRIRLLREKVQQISKYHSDLQEKIKVFPLTNPPVEKTQKSTQTQEKSLLSEEKNQKFNSNVHELNDMFMPHSDKAKSLTLLIGAKSFQEQQAEVLRDESTQKQEIEPTTNKQSNKTIEVYQIKARKAKTLFQLQQQFNQKQHQTFLCKLQKAHSHETQTHYETIACLQNKLSHQEQNVEYWKQKFASMLRSKNEQQVKERKEMQVQHKKESELHLEKIMDLTAKLHIKAHSFRECDALNEFSNIQLEKDEEHKSIITNLHAKHEKESKLYLTKIEDLTSRLLKFESMNKNYEHIVQENKLQHNDIASLQKQLIALHEQNQKVFEANSTNAGKIEIELKEMKQLKRDISESIHYGKRMDELETENKLQKATISKLKSEIALAQTQSENEMVSELRKQHEEEIQVLLAEKKVLKAACLLEKQEGVVGTKEAAMKTRIEYAKEIECLLQEAQAQSKEFDQEKAKNVALEQQINLFQQNNTFLQNKVQSHELRLSELCKNERKQENEKKVHLQEEYNQKLEMNLQKIHYLQEKLFEEKRQNIQLEQQVANLKSQWKNYSMGPPIQTTSFPSSTNVNPSGAMTLDDLEEKCIVQSAKDRILSHNQISLVNKCFMLQKKLDDLITKKQVLQEQNAELWHTVERTDQIARYQVENLETELAKVKQQLLLLGSSHRAHSPAKGKHPWRYYYYSSSSTTTSPTNGRNVPSSCPSNEQQEIKHAQDRRNGDYFDTPREQQIPHEMKSRQFQRSYKSNMNPTTGKASRLLSDILIRDEQKQQNPTAQPLIKVTPKYFSENPFKGGKESKQLFLLVEDRYNSKNRALLLQGIQARMLLRRKQKVKNQQIPNNNLVDSGYRASSSLISESHDAKVAQLQLKLLESRNINAKIDQLGRSMQDSCLLKPTLERCFV